VSKPCGTHSLHRPQLWCYRPCELKWFWLLNLHQVRAATSGWEHVEALWGLLLKPLNTLCHGNKWRNGPALLNGETSLECLRNEKNDQTEEDFNIYVTNLQAAITLRIAMST
jgi:hypothetical protein